MPSDQLQHRATGCRDSKKKLAQLKVHPKIWCSSSGATGRISATQSCSKSWISFQVVRTTLCTTESLHVLSPGLFVQSCKPCYRHVCRAVSAYM